MIANRFSKLLLGLSMACLLGACESNGESGEAAFEDAKEARTTLADSTAISTLADSIQAGNAVHSAKIDAAGASAKKPKALPDAWTLFLRKSEADIAANASLIQRLKGLPDNAKLLKRASQIESDNIDLRASIAEYLRIEQENRTNLQAKVAASLKDISTKLDELKGRSQ